MKRLVMLAVLVLAAVQAYADVSLNGLFTDNMVIQRDIAVPVFGTAEPGEKITVTLGKKSKTVVADNEGKWSVKLASMKASANSVVMTVEGKNKIVLNNVLVGDVWVCSGQSNMEWVLGQCNRDEDVKDADFPLMRQFVVNKNKQPNAVTEVKGAWVVCSPQSAGSFTAAGFYFARKILKETGIPVGLIKTAWGGTRIEPWIAPEGLTVIPENEVEPVKAGLDPKEWHGLYNGMIHPLVKFPIKGAIWYQGESNAISDSNPKKEDTYYQKMCALVGGWRKVWNIGDFPFYSVQLANYQQPNDNPEGGDNWAKIWMAQLRSLSIPNTGMAVAVDLADPGNPGDIHPKNKRDVGERLAAWALAKDYGKKKLVYSGPLYKSMKVEGSKIRISFDSIGSGFMIATKTGYDAPVIDAGGKLRRFAIAGEDRKWVWADAVIDGKTIVVSSPEVPKPAAVRYAFSINPAGCNLYNKEGFPASPFRTDNW